MSNIIDVYLLERTYDNLYRIWLQDGGTKPTESTADQLRINYSGTLNPLKSLSDQIIYHPVKYKILFGSNAEEQLQATFKVVKNLKTNVSDAVIKTRVISAINEFFALGQLGFWRQFLLYRISRLRTQSTCAGPIDGSYCAKPVRTGFWVSCSRLDSAADEIFISGATVDDVSIITVLRSQPIGGFRHCDHININCHDKYDNRISSVRLYYNRFRFKHRQ